MQTYKRNTKGTNIGNNIVYLERLFCENMCFYDHVNYDQCPNEHKGDIAIFSDINYQKSVPKLAEELDKYPELIADKTFDHNLLKEVMKVENNNHALLEMNRLLKIVLSLITKKKEVKRLAKLLIMVQVKISSLNLI